MYSRETFWNQSRYILCMNTKIFEEAVKKAKQVVSGLQEPERSLSFPVILAYFLGVVEDKSAILGSAGAAGRDSQHRLEGGAGDGSEFRGLSGGLRLLVAQSFFKEEKSSGEIIEDLKRQGYHYSRTALPKAMQALYGFRGPLTRFKGADGKWRYVIRK